MKLYQNTNNMLWKPDCININSIWTFYFEFVGTKPFNKDLKLIQTWFEIIFIEIHSCILCSSFHLAFSAPSRAAVHVSHAAALQAGGQDNGPPGPRPHYGPNYYAAFQIDTDGHRIEVVMNRASVDDSAPVDTN